VDFGQISKVKEYNSLLGACNTFNFPKPVVVDVNGFGSLIKSGLTDRELDVFRDAFTPNRNLLFLVAASALGAQRGCFNLVLGFLDEGSALFPDQTDAFLSSAQSALSESLGIKVRIYCPLRDFSKQAVVRLASQLGVEQYYSCHAGGQEPCGRCIACLEYGD
jgi:7-cyano-7-deazaguanine synthase